MKRLRLIWQKEARKITISHFILVSKFTIKTLILTIPKFFKGMEDKDFSNKHFRIDFRGKEAQNHQWFLSFFLFFSFTLSPSSNTHLKTYQQSIFWWVSLQQNWTRQLCLQEVFSKNYTQYTWLLALGSLFLVMSYCLRVVFHNWVELYV